MKKPVLFPGLTDRRRVVLDLAYFGYGAAAEVVERTGELLGVAPPGLQFDAVPGALAFTEYLGTAVEKLLLLGGQFDLIVTEVMEGETTPAVGFLSNDRAGLARTGRRVTLPDRPDEPALPRLDLGLAVWRATHALLSMEGEAFLRLPTASVLDLYLSEDHQLKRVWAAHHRGTFVDLYIRRNYGEGVKYRGIEPQLHHRPSFAGEREWTPGQRQLFVEALTPVKKILT